VVFGMMPARGYGGRTDDLSRESIRATIGQIIEKLGRTGPTPIGDETRLAEDLGFDSLRLIELAIVIEKVFGLPPLDLESACAVQTVRDVADLVLGLDAEERP
jgi:acyl carrier protein